MSVITGPCLNRIKPATSTDKVFKEECVFSFDNPETEHGLYVCLNTFFGIGKQHLDRFSRIYQSQLFLHIKRTRHRLESSETIPAEKPKPTKLAIGVPGGFAVEHDIFDIKDEYQIVFLNKGHMHIYSLVDTSVPSVVVECAKSVIQSESSLLKMLIPDDGNIGWSGELRQISEYCKDLKQINCDLKIPPSGWQCEKCDLKSNLWLNLTDGSIMCGRRFFDGTGGNNHAVEHYEQTGFPLSVKLGTIGEGSTPDVYSYPEGDMVIDTYLDEHLSFFGINSFAMAKSEKSILEMEIDINQKLDSKWASNRILETDKKLEFVTGKGLTPIHNIGSSCYMNSVLQVLFSTRDFNKRYFEIYTEILDAQSSNNGSVVENLEVQLAKIADGLLSGRYSYLPSEYKQRIRPYMLKQALCRNHKEFSTMKQQDAAEFFLFCMQEIRRNNQMLVNSSTKLSPNRRIDSTNQFKFLIEHRSEYINANKCCYTESEEFIIELPVDLNRLTLNQQELIDYIDKCDAIKKEGKDPSTLTTIEPVVSLLDCFDLWKEDAVIKNAIFPGCTQSEEIRDVLHKRVRFKTFPKYLTIATHRFGFNEDWTLKKLKFCICAPDEIDLEHLRAIGPEPNEVLYEEEFGLTSEQELSARELQDYGFSIRACKTAVSLCSSKQEAVELLLEKGEDICTEKRSDSPSAVIEPLAEHLTNLMAMGFSKGFAELALINTNNNIDRAVDWLFSHDESELTSAEFVKQNQATGDSFEDGPGKYRLIAFISHIGNSAMSGHYVVHILKTFENGTKKWVIFDDERVAVSESPPVKYGYIYFYERL